MPATNPSSEYDVEVVYFVGKRTLGEGGATINMRLQISHSRVFYGDCTQRMVNGLRSRGIVVFWPPLGSTM